MTTVVRVLYTRSSHTLTAAFGELGGFAVRGGERVGNIFSGECLFVFILNGGG